MGGTSVTGRVILATKIPLGRVGGLAAYTLALAAGLGERGFSGRFVVAAGPDARPGHLPAGWTVEEWKTRRWLRPLWSRLAARPALHGVAEPVAGWMHPAGDPVSQVDTFVHWIGTGWDAMGYSLLAMARRRGAKFTVLPAVHPESWGDDRIDLRLYGTADAVMCLSDHEAAHLANRGVPEDRLFVTGLPPLCRADGDAGRFRRRHGLGERPTVLFVGRRDSGKGYPALLAAWARVVAVVPDAVLVLGGPGSEEFREARDRLPPGTVVDLGVPDEGEKADALAGCDVFCLPSAHESFGIVYVEAWSYGKPVICGTAPASRELVPAEVAGLHASQDLEELSAALLRLLQNPAEATEMGAAGNRLQEERYTVKRMVDDHLRAWGGI
jgi:glycosyltransferase involved in cell wall biosynthesis